MTETEIAELHDLITNRLSGDQSNRPDRIRSSPGRTRTYDPAVNSRLLYQLSYRGVCSLI